MIADITARRYGTETRGDDAYREILAITSVSHTSYQIFRLAIYRDFVLRAGTFAMASKIEA